MWYHKVFCREPFKREPRSDTEFKLRLTMSRHATRWLTHLRTYGAHGAATTPLGSSLGLPNYKNGFLFDGLSRISYGALWRSRTSVDKEGVEPSGKIYRKVYTYPVHVPVILDNDFAVGLIWTVRPWPFWSFPEPKHNSVSVLDLIFSMGLYGICFGPFHAEQLPPYIW